ncbi:MAG: hypothetical protein NT074_08990 [Methanomicrobiales archaeon]|nr:hypothetical protein [Methanomicrobiales archaeon]
MALAGKNVFFCKFRLYWGGLYALPGGCTDTMVRVGTFIGMDVGGTNTDIAVIGDEITTVKVTNAKGLSAALAHVPSIGRLAVSTSRPLNALISGGSTLVSTLCIPDPGRVYPGGVKGAVDHGGDVVEPLDLPR